MRACKYKCSKTHVIIERIKERILQEGMLFVNSEKIYQVSVVWKKV